MRAHRSESGFTIIELLIASTLTLVVLGTALTGFEQMADTTDGAKLIADVNLTMRSSVNLLTQDLISAGRNIPVGGIPIPSGDDSAPLTRPAPKGVALTFPDNETTIAAVTPGQGLGATINDVATDIITVLVADTTLALDAEFLSAIAADGSTATVDPAIPIDDPATGIQAGDLVMFSNSLGNALQMVTARNGQTIAFDEGDEMNLNQRDAGQGTVVQLQSAPGEYPDTTATRVLMISYYLDASDPDRPRLIRRVNFGPERAIAVGIENVQITYDLVDGDTNPANLPEPVLPNTPDQIRKANIFFSGRSYREWRRTGQLVRSTLATQVGFRNLAFRDRGLDMRTLQRVARSEHGVALVTVMLLLVLSLGMLAGFSTMLLTDQRLRGIDRSRTQAFYGSHGALEVLTADLGNVFTTDFAPSGADITALTNHLPKVDGVALVAPDGTPGYTIDFDADANGNPIAVNRTITSGPFQGFVGLVTPYRLSVIARTPDGAEVRLDRTLNTVSIPVFQFGVYSETDLSFFAGPNFNFGGRVHTNGNLFLASGNGSTLTLAEHVTAVGEVVRANLSNGWATANNYTGTVRGLTAPGVYRNLTTDEGSLVTTLGSAENEPTWTHHVHWYLQRIHPQRPHRGAHAQLALHDAGRHSDRLDPSRYPWRESAHPRSALLLAREPSNPSVRHRRRSHSVTRSDGGPTVAARRLGRHPDCRLRGRRHPGAVGRLVRHRCRWIPLAGRHTRCSADSSRSRCSGRMRRGRMSRWRFSISALPDVIWRLRRVQSPRRTRYCGFSVSATIRQREMPGPAGQPCGTGSLAKTDYWPESSLRCAGGQPARRRGARESDAQARWRDALH